MYASWVKKSGGRIKGEEGEEEKGRGKREKEREKEEEKVAEGGLGDVLAGALVRALGGGGGGEEGGLLVENDEELLEGDFFFFRFIFDIFSQFFF